jgi:hypothetical protein
MSESERKQIEGVCEEISEKNGWVTFSINIGTQYPERLSTKLDAVIASGGENPNKPGTFYQNKRLEKVEVGGTLDPSQAKGPATSAPKSPDERHSIERQTVVKAAIMAYAKRYEDEDAFFQFLGRLAGFVAGNPAVAPAQTSTPPPPAPTQSEGPYAEDDEIPFLWRDNYDAMGMGVLPRAYYAERHIS